MARLARGAPVTRGAEYNGHRNWAHWNVSLYLNNDQDLYNLLGECAERYGPRAARMLQSRLPERTPDGARYSLIALQAAITDWREENPDRMAARQRQRERMRMLRAFERDHGEPLSHHTGNPLDDPRAFAARFGFRMVAPPVLK